MTTRPVERGFRSRTRTYTTIIGVIAAMIAAGLAIPFVFGTPLAAGGSARGTSLATGAPSTIPGSTATGADSQPGASALAGSTGAGGAGGASGPGHTAGAAGSAQSASVSGLTASDKGVTPTTITVAFLLSDLGSVSKLGFGVPGFDIKSQETYINTFVDDINGRGGVFGRKLVPVFVTYDPTNQQTSQSACLAATQDHSIFAAIDSGGGLNEQGQLCFTQQNRTPLIVVGSFGTPQYLYDQSAGYLFSVDPAGARSLANMAALLSSQGLLKGKRLGIVDRTFPGTVDTVSNGLVAVLKQLGYQISYRADLSNDDGTAASQVPVAVQQMQAHGVDSVFMLADFIIGSEFAQSGDKSAYHPLYFTSDFESETNDTAVQAMPSSFQGVGVTVNRTGEWRVGLPEPAVDASCRQTYAKATGQNPARSDNTYAAVGLACGLVNLLVRATTGAGPTLTRSKYVASLSQIGSIPFPFFGSFSYQPGKFDGADAIRTIVYDSSCKCWLPKGPFVNPTY
jgi:ABC-type branched-subunit amino acid transport system substrate-binding protein